MADVQVAQIDRDLAYSLLGSEMIRDGKWDNHPGLQAIARHRLDRIELPAAIAEHVLSMGRVEWGQTHAHDAEGHGAHELREAMYLIRKGGYFYRPNAQGYTTSKAEAGRYTLAEAWSHSHPNGPTGPRDGMDYMLDDEPAASKCPACDGTKVVSQGGHDTGCNACYVSPQTLPAPGEVEGTREALATCASMLEQYVAECLPASEDGKLHFVRVMTDATAAEIRAFLANIEK